MHGVAQRQKVWEAGWTIQAVVLLSVWRILLLFKDVWVRCRDGGEARGGRTSPYDVVDVDVLALFR